MTPNDLITANLVLVPTVMKNHYTPFIRFHGDDMFGYGALALAETAHDFNPEESFKTVAYRAITNAIKRFLWSIGLGEHRRTLSLDGALTERLSVPQEVKPRHPDVEAYLSLCSDHQREILELRYGITDRPWTWVELGKKFGTSATAPRRTHDRAIQRIRKEVLV